MVRTAVDADEPDDYDAQVARYRQQHRALTDRLYRALRAAGRLGRRR